MRGLMIFIKGRNDSQFYISFKSHDMPVTTKKIKSKPDQPLFASADKIARAIMKGLADRSEISRDKTMHPRLSLAVSEWLKAPDLGAYSPALSEFSFTDPGQPIRQIWKVHFEIDDLHDGDRVLTIPAFNPQKEIIAPPGATDVLCFGKLVVIDVVTGKVTSILHFNEIPLFKNTYVKERRYRIKSATRQSSLTVIRMGLNFHQFDGNSKPVQMGNSSGIVAAIYRK
jgi:hypothetical protein